VDRKPLRRVPVWLSHDKTVIYFITCCTANRQPCLANDDAHTAIRTAWSRLPDWKIGRYVIMPDHVHWFASPVPRDADLSKFVQAFRSLATRQLRPLGFPYPLWQREFFDHLLRSCESYETKWSYVWNNPVRHRLVKRAEDWPFCGEICRLEL